MDEPVDVTDEVEELPPEEDLEEAEVYTPGEQESVQVILTPEKRREILGKLAEFEMQLSALAPKWQSFVLAVLQDPTNMAAAARKAGFPENYAKIQANKMLKDSRIEACIALGQTLREDRTMVTSDRTLNELAIIAFSNIGDYTIRPGTNQVEVKEGVPEYALRAVSSAEFTTTVKEGRDGEVSTTYKAKIKLWSKTDALRMLALYQRLLGSEGGGSGSVTINDNRQVHNHQHNTWEIGGRKLQF